MAKPIVDTYLDELAHDLSDLPAAKRRELLAEIQGHIEGALSQIAQPGEADVRNMLERLGDPAEIAEEARERFGVTTTNSGTLELAAVIAMSLMVLIPFIPIVALVGWVIGVVLLWWSRVWSTRDAVIGTAIMPAWLIINAGGPPLPFWIPTFAMLLLVLGLVPLWRSRVWSTRDKAIGTGVIPTLLILNRVGSMGSGLADILLLASGGFALGVILYLARKAYRARPV